MDEDKPITRRRVGRVIPLGYKVSEENDKILIQICLLYTSPSPRDVEETRMPSSA